MNERGESIIIPLEKRGPGCPSGLFGPSKYRKKLDPWYALDAGEGRFTCRDHGGDYDHDDMALHLDTPGHDR